MPVLVIGTLDSKGLEIGHVVARLRAAGIEVLVMDAGVLGAPAVDADISHEAVFEAAGSTVERVRLVGDRGEAVALAAKGVAKLAVELHQQGKITGVLSLGGSAGTTIGTAAMRALPVGIPKLMVSTLASGPVQHYVGTRDVLMMHSVVDLAGINRISRKVLDQAADAMIGMVCASASAPDTDRPLIAASMFGVTTPCVQAARRVLETAGYEVLVFHATGTGGRTMEGLIHDGLIAGVLDITTTELADELVGGILSAGPDRLTAAAIKHVPQVISVGALDMVNFGPRETVPERFQNRRLYQHNPMVTLMRTTPEEMDRLGQEVANKACAANGPTALMLPMRGVSAIDADGKPFWWPEADAALFQSIQNWRMPELDVQEYDAHINEIAFAEACATKLLELMHASSVR